MPAAALEGLGQVTEKRPGRTDRGAEPAATETVQALYAKMIAQGPAGGVLLEGPIRHPGDRDAAVHPFARLFLLFIQKQLGRLGPANLLPTGNFVGGLGQTEIPGGRIEQGKPPSPTLAISPPGRREPSGQFGFRQLHPNRTARTQNPANRPLHHLPGFGLPNLVADGHSSAGLQQLGDVSLRGVVREPAHGHPVAFGQGQVQQSRPLLRILKEKLIKIPQPKKKQGVLGNLRPQSVVLLHHGSRSLGHSPFSPDRLTSSIPDPLPCEYPVRFCGGPSATMTTSPCSLHFCAGTQVRISHSALASGS